MKSVLLVLFPVLISFQVMADLPAMPSSKDTSTDSGDSNAENSEEKSVRPSEGPHKGQLVSAASFNIEILWEAESAKIYLLDSEFKNPSVQGSEVGIFIQSGNTESEMSCQPVEDYFECKQSGKKFKKGQLAISAKRNGIPAEEVKVKVPFEKKADEKSQEAPKKAKDTKKK